MKLKCALLVAFFISPTLYAKGVVVTTLQSIPGKTCEIVGEFPGVAGSEIRYGISGNPVTRSTAEAIKGIRDLAIKQGANTVLGIQFQMIPLERNKGREFGDVIIVGTFANCK